MKEEKPFFVEAYDYLASKEDKHWWFCARNRILLWVLSTKVTPFSNFLEIGCGTGFVLRSVGNRFPESGLFGSEFYEEGLVIARERVPNAVFVQMDARLMTDFEKYDLVGAFDVIEHIEEDALVLGNLFNAIKRGGSILITVPQHRWMWSGADVKACHVRRYSRSELVQKVKSVGFDVVYVNSFVSLLLPLMWLSRRRANKNCDVPNSEFQISSRLNFLFKKVMDFELVLIKFGIRFPFGGSLLLLARKP